MNIHLPVVILLCLPIIVSAQDYAKDLEDKAKKAQELESELENLQKELKNLMQTTNTLKREVPKMDNKTKDRLAQIDKEGTEFRANLDADFTNLLDGSMTTLLTYIRTVSLKNQYKWRLANVDRDVKNYQAKYDNYSIGLTREISRCNVTLQKYLKEYNALKEPLVERINKILSNELPDDQKLKKLELISKLQNNFFKISQQVQRDAFHEEEKQRSDVNSGIKQIRTSRVGSENYHANTHTGGSFSAIHDHSNNIRTVGMGEFIGVLNGVEFRTRHNDYRLKMAVKDDKRYHETQNVPFPNIPTEVTNKATPEEQITEMREWFKAYHSQNHTVRDYRNYFKPLLVYLEGAWTVGNAGGSIDEPFESDRHHVDAKSWLDLQEKVRFTSYAGAKSLLENLAHLPTKILRFTDDYQPVLAQWNYRLSCHPIGEDIPLKNLKLVPDLAAMKRNGQNEERYKNSRAAKYDIEGIDIYGKRQDIPLEYSFLDKIMEQIPGKDNYGAQMEIDQFGAPGDTLYTANPLEKGKKLNAAHYHRVYKHGKNKDKLEQKSFSDRVWFAHTTQSKVAQVSHNITHDGSVTRVSHRVSYAVPVEVIILTPLSTWNPYNVANVGSNIAGAGIKTNPYNGYTDRSYTLTPDDFFSGEETNPDPADTAKSGGVFVSTSSGAKAVRASGVRIMFPDIKGIDGKIRQRFPVMPVAGEGSAVWKKLNAVEDAVKIIKDPASSEKYLKSGASHSTHVANHRHILPVPTEHYGQLKRGTIKELKITSNKANGHLHDFTVVYKDGKFSATECNSPSSITGKICWDNHSVEIEETEL